MHLKCYSEIGAEIFTQGSTAGSMLVIVKGTVSIKIDGVEKRKMKAPEVLGEKALVGSQEHRRGATAICASKSVEILCLKRKDYVKLVEEGFIDEKTADRVRRDSERWSTSRAPNTKVTPMSVREKSEEIKNHLAQVRAQYGASSKEYLEAAESVNVVSTADPVT